MELFIAQYCPNWYQNDGNEKMYRMVWDLIFNMSTFEFFSDFFFNIQTYVFDHCDLDLYSNGTNFNKVRADTVGNHLAKIALKSVHSFG